MTRYHELAFEAIEKNSGASLGAIAITTVLAAIPQEEMEVLGEHAEATNQAASANVELPLDTEDETRSFADLEPTTKAASGAIN